MLTRALEPLATNPQLRNAILDVRRSYEQTIDEASKDEVLFAGHSAEARERASAMISSFREYIEEHKDDIRALQVLYSRPHRERLTFTEVKELARAIERPPRQWTPDTLWRAYEMLDRSKVRGSGGKMLTDIVSLVRYTLHQDDELVPFRDQVEQRYAAWLNAQEQMGVSFSAEQLQWLTWMKENIAGELGIAPDSFDYTPFVEHGGIGKAVQVFGDQLTPLLTELTEAGGPRPPPGRHPVCVVIGGPVPPTRAAHVQAAALRAAFPQYAANVITRWDNKPRFEVVSRDGGDPYCLISDDAREIWHALTAGYPRGAGGGCGARFARSWGHGFGARSESMKGQRWTRAW
jgi:hypothetical protein